MRPADVTNKEVVDAGVQLQQENKRVTGYSLRRIIGRGAPERMMAVWDVHVAQQLSPKPSTALQDLPEEVESILAQLLSQQAGDLRGMSYKLMRALSRELSAQLAPGDAAAAKQLSHATWMSSQLDASENRCAVLRQELEALRAAQAQSNSVIARLTQQLHDAEDAAGTPVATSSATSAHLTDDVSELSSLKITTNAVTDLLNSRTTELAVATRQLKDQSERIVDLHKSNDALRNENNRVWQMCRAHEDRCKLLEAQAGIMHSPAKSIGAA